MAVVKPVVIHTHTFALKVQVKVCHRSRYLKVPEVSKAYWFSSGRKELDFVRSPREHVRREGIL